MDDASGNPPVTHNFTATLYDCTRDHRFGDQAFAAAYEVVTGGPEALAVPMPKITSIVLEPAGNAVTLTYENDGEHEERYPHALSDHQLGAPMMAASRVLWQGIVASALRL